MPGAPSTAGIGAAVDLGSTSVHLLVAEVVGHRVRPLVDESVFLGLGSAVEQRGLLGAEAREGLVDALAHYAWTARQAGAQAITFVGTEPLRRLADASRIVDQVDQATGVGLHVLGHEEEAFLMLVGVTAGRPVERETLVIDVGGGSSEFVSIGPGRRAAAAGVRVGAAALTSRHVAGDPPTGNDLASLRAAAHRALAAAPDATPDEIVLVGGTASNLLKLVPEAAERRTLRRADLARALAVVAAVPSEALTISHGVKPVRARILGAGLSIVEAILDRYGRDEARVADAGIREGTILTVMHGGSGWRDRLEELAHGWTR